MSGIEVVGLILGVIPLVISALEHYEDFIGPSVAFIKYHGNLNRARRELRNQHTLFEQSILILLTPITKPEERSNMIDNSNCALWKDATIEESLRDALGFAYPVYMDIFQDIQKILITIAQKLNIDGSDSLSLQGLEAVVSKQPPAKEAGILRQKFEFQNRIKFTMKREKIRTSLARLQENIDTLDKLHDKAEKLQSAEALPSRGRLPRFALPLDIIRQNAERLYRVLSQSWSCSDHAHASGLLLEQRLKKRKIKAVHTAEKGVRNYQYFDMTFFSPVCQKWLDVEIRVLEVEATGALKSNVKITFTTTEPASAGPQFTQLQSADVPTAVAFHKLKVINNLCGILQSPCHDCLGFCLDWDGNLRGTYEAMHRANFADHGMSLQQLLLNGRAMLSQKEQYRLSITLASSLLQLSRTPWLRATWGKTDIIFHRAKLSLASSSTDTLPVDVDHPYLAREHMPEPSMGIVRRQTGDWNDASKFLGLGVLLVEILSRQPIEKLYKDGDLGPNGQPNELTNLQVIRRWLREQESAGGISLGFRSAIAHCLRCFAAPEASVDNDDFARAAQEQIIGPLELEMDCLFSR